MTDPPNYVREQGTAIVLSIHVQPKARQSGFAGFHGDALKLKVAAPPVEDAANRAVVDFFSRLLGIPKTRIRILAGCKSREKRIQIEGVTVVQFVEVLQSSSE